ncbi:MAG: FtsW/RodA/SpoVE family cell cycle protein [candidate division WOR-3 bacterium]
MFIALLLSIIGIIEIWTINPVLAQKQIIFLLFSVFLGYFIYLKFKFAYIEMLFFPILIITIFLLFLVHFLGNDINRWIDLKFFYFQPSEITKMLLPFLFYIYNPSDNLIKVSIIIFILFLLIITQPDLGFSISILFVSFFVFLYSNVNKNLLIFILFSIMAVFTSFNIISFVLTFLILIFVLFFSKSRWYWTTLTILTFIFISIITPIIWNNILKPYQRTRIIAFLNPEAYKKNEAYQIYQSQIAIGSGKLLGNGFNKGTQKKYGFLPEAHTDFIFASICEDFGFLGGFITLTLIFILILRVLFILNKIDDERLKRFTLTIALFYIYSFIVNISVNLGLMPAKGYPLLFVSYGGSHLLLDYICLFLIMLVKKNLP